MNIPIYYLNRRVYPKSFRWIWNLFDLRHAFEVPQLYKTRQVVQQFLGWKKTQNVWRGYGGIIPTKISVYNPFGFFRIFFDKPNIQWLRKGTPETEHCEILPLGPEKPNIKSLLQRWPARGLGEHHIYILDVALEVRIDQWWSDQWAP